LYFYGSFCGNRVSGVVIWWCGCGGLRGEGGQEATIKSSEKNTPTFSTLFLRMIRLPLTA
jgi:hypothetical protein